MEKKVAAVMEIKSVDLPVFQTKFNMNTQRCRTLSRQVINAQADKNLSKLKKATFEALADYKKKRERRVQLLGSLLSHLRKSHLFYEFRKLRVKANILTEVRNKDKINGAYLLLKRFKDRLKAFDRAMQTLNKSKVN